MTKEGSPVDTTDEQLLTPEQLAVLNIEALMKERGVTRSELARRLKDLGFETWRHEKTIRNLFDGQRGLKVDELFAIAASLNSSALALTATETRRAVFPEEGDIGPRMSLGDAVRGKEQYQSIWFGTPLLGIPVDHLDWAAWRPGTTPAWVNRLLQSAETIVNMYTQLGFEAPAATEKLTTAQIEEMMAQISKALDAESPE